MSLECATCEGDLRGGCSCPPRDEAPTIDRDPTAIPLRLDPRERRMVGIAVHGNTPFDVPYISHIVFNLWTGGCADDLMLPTRFKHIISLYPWERYRIKHKIISESYNYMYDSDDPEDMNTTALKRISDFAYACMMDGPTLVHCQAGLNRSALIGALVLMRRGRTAQKAIALLREQRSPAVLCNPLFERWLLDLDEE